MPLQAQSVTAMPIWRTVEYVLLAIQGYRRNCRRACRFAKAEGGSAAVEFALVALPFLGLMGATVETAVGFWAQQELQLATAEAGRQIYTGQFQTKNTAIKGSEALLVAFKNELCKENGTARRTIFVCQDTRVHITRVDEFSNTAPMSPTKVDAKTGDSNWNPDFGKSYACGTNSSIVTIQAAVEFPLFFTYLSPWVATISKNKRLLQAAAVFRVEPYDSTLTCA